MGLAENEELIGVYGVKDYYENFITFGFVVKVKPEQASYTCPTYTPEPVQPDDTPLPIDSYVIPSDNNNDQINTEEDKDAIDTLFDDIFGALAESIEDFNN